MSSARESDIPTDSISDCRPDLEKLAESDLPVAEYANNLLDLLEKGDRGQ